METGGNRSCRKKKKLRRLQRRHPAPASPVTLFCDWSLLAAIYTILFDRAFGNRKKQAVSFGVAALLLGLLDWVSYALEMPPLPALGHAAASCIGIGASGIVILCLYKYDGHAVSLW